jgi:hypothetical protein
VIALLHLHGSKKVGSGRVTVFVTLEVNILLQAFNNTEAISELDHVTNASERRYI